jgi:nitrous oxidase accessory protein NosD
MIFCLALPALAGEGRTPIFAAPTTINSSGKYVVTRNLVNPGGAGVLINILAPDVDLDLNGFILDNSANPGSPVIGAGPSASLTIRDGTLIGGFRGVQVIQGEKVTIEDLKINQPQDIGIYLQQVRTLALRRNLIVDAGTDGIRLQAVPGFAYEGTIEHNIIRDCGTAAPGGTGIIIYDASSLAILHNRIEGIFGPAAPPPALGSGIYLERVSGSLLAENTIQEVSNTGIEIRCDAGFGESYGNKLFDNVIHSTQVDGISLTEFCDDHLIVRNVVTHCVFDGIQIGGDFNYIFQNHSTSNFISGGSFGLVFLATANGNTYSQNTARNNTADFADFNFIPPFNDSFGDNMMPGPPPF